MSDSQMKVDPARANALISQFREVQQRITTVAKGRTVSGIVLLLLIYQVKYTETHIQHP